MARTIKVTDEHYEAMADLARARNCLIKDVATEIISMGLSKTNLTELRRLLNQAEQIGK